MDLPQLVQVLQACMSHDQSQRQQAEQHLKQAEAVKGQAVNLLRVAAEESVDPAVRQVAAISFKNLCRRSWDVEEGSSTYQIPADDQQVVRDNLLESLIRAPHVVQVQLGEVFKTIVYSDYPEKWPGLLQALCTNMVNQDPLRVHGGLYALRILARKYEFRDESERAPMTELVNTALPLLLQIFNQLLTAPQQTPEVATYIKLVAKVFWSTTYMGIPDLLLQPEMFNGWMTALLTAVGQQLPESVQPASHEDRASSPWWKSRKWIFHITYRLYSRYSVPKHCKEGNDRKFSELFSREYSVRFLDAHLAVLAGLANGAYLSPRVTNLVIQYISVATNIKAAYKHVGAHWDDILMRVAFPLMCFTDEDAELWAEDPHEYIRKGYDILEDMYSPKTAAANLAHDLCCTRKEYLAKFMAAMSNVMTEYVTAEAAGGADPAKARRMDGALLAVGCMSEKLKGSAPYKAQLGPLLLNLVVPCFGSRYGHLRAKAAWVAGVFCDVEFPDGQGSGPTYSSIFSKVVALLADPELPVRVDAVVALRQFIDNAEEIESLKPLLPTLLNAIFNLMGEIDAEDLVFSLEAMVEKFREEIAPYAAQMVAHLAAAFARYSAQEGEGDEDGDDDDMAGIAAYGCLRAINTLLESVAGLGQQLYPVLEETLYPLMHKLISSDGQDVIEEVLEMLAYLTFYGPGISPRLWALWPQMHQMLMEFGIDYWENLLVPLDNMISRDTAHFVSCKDPDYLASVYQMVSHSLNGDFSDRDVVSAARLMEVVMQACRGKVDAWIAPYIQLALTRLARTEKRALRDALVCVVANALYYNPALGLSVLQSTGALASFFGTWMGMVQAAKSSGKPQHFRRMHDKKVCALGLLSLLACPPEALPAEVSNSLHLVTGGVVRLLTTLKEQKEQVEAAAAEDDEDEDEDDILEGSDGEAWDDDEKDEEDEAGEEEYLARLKKQAKELLGAGDDEDDSDDEFTDDEEVSTPLDAVDPWVLLADTLNHINATQPARAQAAVAGVDPSALQTMMTFAEQQRAAAITVNGAA